MRQGVAHAEKAPAHAPPQSKGEAVIDAGSRALKNIDGAQPRLRPLQRIDAWRKRASQRLRELPGGKRIHWIKRPQKIRAAVVKYGVLQYYWLGQVHV